MHVYMYSVWMSVDLQTRGRCGFDNLRYRAASAAARLQPELACLRQGLDRSDETVSVSQILSDGKNMTR